MAASLFDAPVFVALPSPVPASVPAISRSQAFVPYYLLLLCPIPPPALSRTFFLAHTLSLSQRSPTLSHTFSRRVPYPVPVPCATLPCPICFSALFHTLAHTFSFPVSFVLLSSSYSVLCPLPPCPVPYPCPIFLLPCPISCPCLYLIFVPYVFLLSPTLCPLPSPVCPILRRFITRSGSVYAC